MREKVTRWKPVGYTKPTVDCTRFVNVDIQSNMDYLQWDKLDELHNSVTSSIV